MSVKSREMGDKKFTYRHNRDERDKMTVQFVPIKIGKWKKRTYIIEFYL